MTPSETSPPATEAEFSPEENAVFSALGMRMHFVGIFTLGLGLVAVVMGLSRRDAGPLLAGVLYAIIGHWTSRAGKQFRIIARTRGHDHSHLMAALVDLRKLYTLQYWICLVALVATLVLLGTSALY
jgi:hypothetical protein